MRMMEDPSSSVKMMICHQLFAIPAVHLLVIHSNTYFHILSGDALTDASIAVVVGCRACFQFPVSVSTSWVMRLFSDFSASYT